MPYLPSKIQPFRATMASNNVLPLACDIFLRQIPYRWAGQRDALRVVPSIASRRTRKRREEVMTLIDAAASTAFAALRPTPSSGGSSGGIARHQQGGTDANRSSAATRLGSIDPVPPHEDERGGRTMSRGRMFSFGAIADVQYADQDDGWNFQKDHRRYYRGGLRQLRGAVDVWLKDETHRFAFGCWFGGRCVSTVELWAVSCSCFFAAVSS